MNGEDGEPPKKIHTLLVRFHLVAETPGEALEHFEAVLMAADHPSFNGLPVDVIDCNSTQFH